MEENEMLLYRIETWTIKNRKNKKIREKKVMKLLLKLFLSLERNKCRVNSYGLWI